MVNIIKPLQGTSVPVAGDFSAAGEIAIDTSGKGLYILVGSTVTPIGSPAVGSSNIVTTGALNSGSITSGFGNIDTGSSTITTTGAVATGALTVTGALLPAADDTHDLGSTTAAWQDLYLEGNLNFTDDSNVANVSTISGHSGSNILLDSANGIILDGTSASVGIQYKDGGTELLRIHNYDGSGADSNVHIESKVSDKDIIFKGNDGGSAITALTLDMSASGKALFNDTIEVGDDIKMTSDGATLKFGGDSEVTLEHQHNTGIRLNGAMQLQFNDDGSYIMQDSESFYIRGHNDMYFNIDTPNDSTARHFLWRANTSSELMRLGEDKLLELQGDFHLDSDAVALKFGDDQDVTLTHVADTGLLLNGSMALQFNDSTQNIKAPNGTTLDINATDEIELNATLVDVNANLDVSGTFTVAGDFTANNIYAAGSTFHVGDTNTYIGFTGNDTIEMQTGGASRVSINDAGFLLGNANARVTTINTSFADNDTTLMTSAAINDRITAVAVTLSADNTFSGDNSFTGTNTIGTTNKLQFRDTGLYINSSADGQLDIVADTEVQIAATTIDMNGAVDISGDLTLAGDVVISATNTIDIQGDMSIDVAGGDLRIKDDGVQIGRFATGTSDLILASSVQDKDIYFQGNDGGGTITALQLDMSDAGTAYFNNDVRLNSDSSVIAMGAGNDVTLTHDGSTGATLASAGDFIIDCEADITLDANGGDVKLLDGGAMYGVFTNNSGQLKIKSGATASLSLSGADVTVEDDLFVKDNIYHTSDGSITGWGVDTDTTLTHVDGTGLILNSTNKLCFNAATNFIHYSEESNSKDVLQITAQGDIRMSSGDDIELDITDSGNTFRIKDDGTVFFRVDPSNGHVDLDADGAELHFGANEEIVLAHVHDTGLKLTDSGGSPTLQFHDANEAVSSDGSKLILTSNGVAFSMPTADGSNGQQLTTNGSGVLSWAAAGSSGGFDTAGTGLTSSSTTVNVIGGDGITANANDVAITAAQTTVTSMLNSSLVMGRDAHNQIKFSTDDQIIFRVGNADNVIFKTSGEIEAASLDISGNVDVDGTLETDALSIGSTTVTSTAAELNILDGVTSTAAELNILDGVTSTAAELNILDGVTATATELNKIDGYTGTTAELNYNDTGVSAGTVAGSKTIVADSNKDITGGRNITISGELDAATLDISGNMDLEGDIDVNGTSNLDVVDIDGAVDMASTLTLAGNADFNGNLDVDGTSNLDVVDIDGAVDMASTLTLAGNADFNGNLDVDGTTNLDVVDIDGAVDMASTLAMADHITMATDHKVQFRDTATYIKSNDANDLYVIAAADLLLSGPGTMTYESDQHNFGETNTSTDVVLTFNSNGNDGQLTWDQSADTFVFADKIDVPTSGLKINGTAVTSTAAELNLLDGITHVRDEDDMSSDSATSLATQQSIKAYVDANAGGGGGTPTAITVAATTDSTCFVGLFESATGDLGPKTDGGLLYDASSNKLAVGGNIETGSYLQDDGGTLNLAAASTSYSIYFRGGTTTKFRMGMGSGSSWYFRPTSDDNGYLGTSSKAWNRSYVRSYYGYDGSGFSAGATMSNSGGPTAFLTSNGMDAGTGAAANLTLATAGGVTVLADVQPAASDSRYKENVTDLDKGLTFLDSFPKAKTFDFKDTVKEIGVKEPKKGEIGFLAQDIEKLLPDVVVTTKTEDSEFGEFKTINYPDLNKTLIYSLVNAVKELSTRVKELESK